MSLQKTGIKTTWEIVKGKDEKDFFCGILSSLKIWGRVRCPATERNENDMNPQKGNSMELEKQEFVPWKALGKLTDTHLPLCEGQ